MTRSSCSAGTRTTELLELFDARWGVDRERPPDGAESRQVRDHPRHGDGRLRPPLAVLGLPQRRADESWAPRRRSSAARRLLVGGGVLLATRSTDRRLGRRDAVLLVTVSWIVGALYAACPYFIWSTIGDPDLMEPSLHSFASCFFEGMSGLTTTGATIINDIESMPRGLLALAGDDAVDRRPRHRGALRRGPALPGRRWKATRHMAESTDRCRSVCVPIRETAGSSG